MKSAYDIAPLKASNPKKINTDTDMVLPQISGHFPSIKKIPVQKGCGKSMTEAATAGLTTVPQIFTLNFKFLRNAMKFM